MYIIEFFRNLVQKKNIGTIIWMILNLYMIISCLSMSDDRSVVLYGLLIYAASLAIALSPIGEGILRYQTGCKEIQSPQVRQRIEPIFQRVYQRAKAESPELPDDIRLFINSDPSPNAFATGRRTVCFTEGLLNLSDEQIQATLAHEFGHLAHKDTDLILVVAVGNLLVNILFCVIRFIYGLFVLLLSAFVSDSQWFLDGMYHIFVTLLLGGLMKLWTKIGVWLCLHSGRQHEYEADAYAARLGYGNGLIHMLQTIQSWEGPAPEGLFAALSSSHPKTALRIQALEAIAVSQQVKAGN